MDADLTKHRIEQLRKYARWEKEHDSEKRLHILDWAADEIDRLRSELAAAREALQDIVEPIRVLEREAAKTGSRLDGATAVHIARDPEFLRDIAGQALARQQKEGKADG